MQTEDLQMAVETNIQIVVGSCYDPNKHTTLETQGLGGNFEMGRSPPNNMPRQSEMIFEVDEDRCFGCAACAALGPVNALVLDGLLAIVDEPECTHCEHCIPACPVHALSLVNVKGTASIGVLA